MGVYLFGSIGFIVGFIAGLVVIHLFLRGYTKHQLVSDKSLRWTYGLAVWVFAAIGAYGGVWLFDRTFG